MAGRADHDPRTVLERLLHEQDRTYEEVAAEFCRQAEKLGERGVGITARHLRRLASGERAGTTPATRRVLQALFGLSADELLRPCSPSDATSLVLPVRSRSDVELVTMAAERSRDFFLQQRLVVDSEAVDLLSDEVRELAREFQRMPLAQILGRVIRTQEAVLSSLDQKQKPVNARRLYFLASVLGGMLAYAGGDVGKPQVAMSHARTAFMWAEYADHNGLRGWIRGIQSYLCYWTNQPREAIRYAQSGAQYLPAQRGTVRPWLIANEARAWASLGDAERTKELILRATHIAEHLVPDELDEFGGICTFGTPKLLYYAGRALAGLPGEPDAARDYAGRAVEAYRQVDQDDWDFSCQADSHLSLAIARARGGELDGVAEALGPVLSLPPEQRIHDLINTATVLHRALNPYATSPDGRDLQDALEHFARTSLPRFPV
ncbi:XRE family transcriptional regulator [Pseudonocardiaceae bacterium YIM PH 21723]|nr:XRE family transcriptional regulator [Pseudonocardiaceae bacterium YIM PH 21723]